MHNTLKLGIRIRKMGSKNDTNKSSKVRSFVFVRFCSFLFVRSFVRSSFVRSFLVLKRCNNERKRKATTQRRNDATTQRRNDATTQRRNERQHITSSPELRTDNQPSTVHRPPPTVHRWQLTTTMCEQTTNGGNEDEDNVK